MTATTFAERLSRLRHRAGVSRLTVAYATGLSKNHIELLEDARRPSNPTLKTITALAAYYQVAPAWLAFGDGHE